MKFDEYMLIGEAAKFMGVCLNTLRNWEKAKKIKVYRHPINKYRLYKREDLRELLILKYPGISENIQEK